ncbi:MAG: hypothetical protein IJE02_04370 [Clostridia bacterium]|nr:hypothetical protein [Clostridia bacterium]
MSFDIQLKNLMKQINDFKASEDNSLPQNTFYLNENQILCRERDYGVSRFAYDANGLVVWARSSGHIDAYESTFTIFRELNNFEDASIAFMGGLKQENGEYFPISLFECHRQLFENIDIKRYVVYSFRYAYYIADTSDVTFAVRVHADMDKHIHFAFAAINKSDKPQSIYMMSCMDAWLFYRNNGGVYDIMNRFGKRYQNGNYLLRSYGDSMTIGRAAFGKEPDAEYLTTQKSAVLGPVGRLMTNAASLKSGVFANDSDAANSVDVPVCADSAHYTLNAGESVRREYELQYFHTIEEAEAVINYKPDIEKIDTILAADEELALSKFATMQTHFENYNGGFNAKVLNKFVRNIQKQISFCALGKNYFGPMMGVRDVMQQLESSLIWQPRESRAQFINALNHILEDGRPPRQFSNQESDDYMPMFDLRKFIDQGVWIITTLHTYLAYTNDWSILDEKCGYYVAAPDNSRLIAKSEIVDTVLDHIVKIMDFLCSNIDEETGCLHSLYGDWNDALDGLGKTTDKTREYGTGVSVMCSLQLYQNCTEICEILKAVSKYSDKVEKYEVVAETLKNGLTKYAVDTNNSGERRIMHGWGDNRSYKIGSWCDPDGNSRYSSTANSFWAISGMVKNDPSMKETVMQAFKTLDSKYGIMTFDKAFPLDMHKYVGRIANISAGTYENAGTYVHATMFAVSALFLMGESQEAWRQFDLGTVLSHADCSKSPFAMPNSYFRNEELCIDGQSFADWYTGSGTVFIKNLVKFGFGVCPTLDGLVIQTAGYMPTTDASIDVIVKGHPITVKYQNEGNGSRTFKVNGKEMTGEFDSMMNIPKLFMPTADICDNMVIEVID